MTYQYIPFAKPDGKSAGTYINDLVYQVNLKVKLIFSHLFSIHRNTMLCTTILASYLYIMHHTLHRNRSMMAWSEIQLLLQTGLSMSILRCLTRKVVSQWSFQSKTTETKMLGFSWSPWLGTYGRRHFVSLFSLDLWSGLLNTE